MLVYGDRSEMADVHDRLDAIAEKIARVREMSSGLDRHEALVTTLIDAGQLLQGMADAGLDEAELLNAFLMHLAAAVIRSSDSGFGDCTAFPEPPQFDCRTSVELRVPEGFAFYAVYPEAYARAARQLRLLGPPRVIGIRSIGTTLAAVAAAALGAPPPVTVRPAGDPFARRVDLPERIADDGVHYVIVDEGPGQSGSSFGAVADWLEVRGVPVERIAFLPSHGGDIGPQGSDKHRRRWRQAQRVPAEFDGSWLAKLFGPLEKFAVGGQLKFLGSHDGERVLLKFAGLGEIGPRKLEIARALHAAGFTPEPLALVHGFLAERWSEGLPLAADENAVEQVGRYIGGRAALFPANAPEGASVHELLTMCRRNLSLAGLEFDHRWDPERLARRVSRVRTDNKLDRGKWLRLGCGRLIKCDALDHHQGHDLIGCQDPTWDVAGAIVEFELAPDEAERLIAATGRAIDRELLDFCLVAYCSFRLGCASLAGDRADADRYAASLQHLHPQYCRSVEPA